MGSNLGHLSRLLPLGRRLRARGHKVLAVVRDLALAGPILGPAGIPFIQAPYASVAARTSAQPASYADMLRHTGWADAQQLWSITQAWVNLFRLFAPDLAVLDHSPTALLAARCERTPCVLIGTGFELPPASAPLPCFPGFPGATLENATRAEAEVLQNANQIMRVARAPSLRALYELFQSERRWLTTFAELDHYNSRPTECYVGPIGEIQQGERIEWRGEAVHRIFAYLRADTPNLPVILRMLETCGGEVVCYGPGITPARAGADFKVTTRPVDLPHLLKDASLCVSYAPAGTVTTTLLEGVPQLLAPAHVEAQLTAHRVECMGAGLTLPDASTDRRADATLQTLLSSSMYKTRAAEFAARYQGFDPGKAADEIVEDIQSLLSRRGPSTAVQSPVARPEC
jgi:UDP:flavonoid glycosyltransferase YjiC (YdhE family)